MNRAMPNLRLSLLVIAALLLIPAVAAAEPNSSTDKESETPTFYEDVLPIMQDNCQVCHRPGGANLGGMVAPMSFTSYEEARPWAKSIAKQVEARLMPPWHASQNQHGVFDNERTLEPDEIDALVRWAKAGAPVGDPSKAPAPRVWPENNGWSIGEPDLVIDMGTKYFVEDDVEDQYITFETEITEEMLPTQRWVKALEFRPGSPVVHHIIAMPLGGIAPGNDPDVYYDGFGTLLKPGTKIRWQMHYHKEPGPGTGAWDFSEAALRFYPEGYKPDHVVLTNPLASMDFRIPPGDPNYSAQASMKFERETLVLAFLPHMHLRGKSAHYVAKYPDGTEEVLLEVPRYDFNWQTQYKYPAPGKLVPAGTEIHVTLSWDNSADNPSNPDPTAEVVFGEPTTAEMMFGFVNYTDAETGYMPPADEGWFGNREARLKKFLKERFDLDWDTMTEEEREEVMERIREMRAKREGASVGR